MGIKLSVADPKESANLPPTSATERLRLSVVLILGGIIEILRRVVLPHFLLAFGLLFVTGFALFRVASQWPTWMAWVYLPILAILLFACAFGYALLTSLFCALKQAATYTEEFFYELLEAVKDKIRQKIDNLEEGVAKQQARVMLDNSVREVFAPLKQLRIGSVPGVLLTLILGILTFVSRSVFLARLARISGKTVHFSTIFASRATLVGALFLNMRWLAALLLWTLYAVGILIFIIDVWWML